MTVKYYLLMFLLIITLFNEIFTHKVKNIVVIPFLLGGFIINGYLAGMAGILDSLLASLIPILVLGVFFILKMLGAGDIKLFSAIGAIMGVTFIINDLVYSALAGGFIALLILVLRQNTQERFKYLFNYLKHCLLMHSLPPYSTFSGEYNDSKLPYVSAIAIGTMITLLIM